MKSIIAFLFGVALATFLFDLLTRFLMFTLQPDYVRRDCGLEEVPLSHRTAAQWN